MYLSQKGFTLIELIVALAILVILAAIAGPSYSNIMASAKYKEAARNIASTLRDARSRAITQNLEHRVNFEVSQKRYQLERGNSSSGSTTWNPVFGGWTILQPGVEMSGKTTCDDNSDRPIQFNPNGTSQSEYICVMDSNLTEKFKVGITSATTGRIIIE